MITKLTSKMITKYKLSYKSNFLIRLQSLADSLICVSFSSRMCSCLLNIYLLSIIFTYCFLSLVFSFVQNFDNTVFFFLLFYFIPYTELLFYHITRKITLFFFYIFLYVNCNLQLSHKFITSFHL